MSSPNHRLGGCPRCGEEIQHHHVLIEYEMKDEPQYWAECPSCGDVVDPDV